VLVAEDAGGVVEEAGGSVVEVGAAVVGVDAEVVGGTVVDVGGTVVDVDVVVVDVVVEDVVVEDVVVEDLAVVDVDAEVVEDDDATVTGADVMAGEAVDVVVEDSPGTPGTGALAGGGPPPDPPPRDGGTGTPQLCSTDAAVFLIDSACGADVAGGPAMTALSSVTISRRTVRHWAHRSGASGLRCRSARVTATFASRTADRMALIVPGSSAGSCLPVSARSSASRVAAISSRTSASPSGEVAAASRTRSTTRLAG
jgi:hypothetical protein